MPQDIQITLLTLHLFMTHAMMKLIIKYSNAFAMHRMENHNDAECWTPLDIDELNTFLVCLLYVGFSKSHHESCEQLWAADLFFELH